MLFFTFIQLMANNEKLVDFLIEHGVLPSKINCGNCGAELNINKETLLFRCHRKYFTTTSKKKRVCKKCDFKKSAKIGTWFASSNLKLDTICKIIASFLMLRPPRQEDLQEELNISSTTVVDWFSFCREVCAFWADKCSEKLGGPGHTVEIDEAKIGHRKYNRGRLLKGNWIFGGYEHRAEHTIYVRNLYIGSIPAL